MRRITVILLLILTIFLGYWTIVKGYQADSIGLKVYNYSEIVSESESLSYTVAAYNKLNSTTYNEMLDSLDAAIDEYEEAKEEYEAIIEEIGTTEETTDASDEIVLASSLPVYEIDFLWTTIGNYAKKEGLTITMDVSQNSTVSDALGYGLYNLSFYVTGAYIDIADFLYDIEDDDQLGFEIRDYEMTAEIAEETNKDEGYEEGDIIGTIATFTIYNVPLNSDTLYETVIEDEEEEEEEEETGNNWVGIKTSEREAAANNTTNTTSSDDDDDDDDD